MSKEYRQHVGEGLLQLIMYMTKINFIKRQLLLGFYATNCFKNKPHHSSFPGHIININNTILISIVEDSSAQMFYIFDDFSKFRSTCVVHTILKNQQILGGKIQGKCLNYF